MLIDPTWVEASGYGSKAGVIRMEGRTRTHRSPKYTSQSKEERFGRHRRQAASMSYAITRSTKGER